jgi:hypothetical protein
MRQTLFEKKKSPVMGHIVTAIGLTGIREQNLFLSKKYFFSKLLLCRVSVTM